MAKHVRSGKPSSTVPLGKEGILPQEWRYLRHMLYTTHRNHRVRKGHFLSVCSVFYLQSLLERCLSLSQTIQVPKTAWCEPQHHNFWFRGAAGKTKIPWRCFEQACAVLCTSPVAKAAAPAGISLPLEWHSSGSWQGGRQSCWVTALVCLLGEHSEQGWLLQIQRDIG